MWCRAIVAAIALSYVICVLLLSGLQKESLDAATLQKLQRHNINIHDMSNENIRQECSMQVYSSTQNYDVSDDDTSLMSINKSRFSAADIQRSETVATEMYPENSFKVLVDETKKDVLNKEHTSNRNDNVKSNSEPEENIKISGPNNEPIDYNNKGPSLETVLQFWNKFSRNSNTDAIPKTNTIKQEVVTTTKNSITEGYVHFREMDYISRILTEYLASKTISTTTHKVMEKDKTEDIISKTINEFLDKHKEISPITVWNTEVNIHNKTDEELSNLGKSNTLGNNNNKAKAKLIPEHMTQRETISHTTAIIPNTKTVAKELEQKIEVLKYLNDMFRLGNAFNLNIPITSTERSLQDAYNYARDNQKMTFQYTTRDTSSRTSKPVKKLEEINNEFRDASGNIIDIEAIANRVKEMVMRDISYKIATKASITSTSSPTTTVKRKTEKSTTSRPETNEKNLMIQTLMDVFEEFKKRQNKTRATTEKPLQTSLNHTNLDSLNSLLDRILPPVINSDIKQLNPGNYQKFVPIPLGPPVSVLQQIPYMLAPNMYDLRAPPITIQSNGGEIPPLLISVSKPIKLMNQPIILTTLNPLERQRHERLQIESKNQLNDKFSLDVDTETGHMDTSTYDVLQKKLRTAEAEKKEFRDFYKERIKKLNERTKQVQEHNDRARVNTPSESEYQFNKNRYTKAEPTHPEFDQDAGLTIQKYFGTPESLETLDRSEHTKYHSLSRPQSSNYYETLSQSLDYNRQDGPRPKNPSYHELLSRQRAPNHRDIGRFHETNPYKGRPLETEEKHSHTSFDRGECEHGQYKPKFHDELEHTENRPENHKHLQGPSDCCRAVPTREQIPMTRIEHPKHDDTHFKHFLASQQKVTDMLEKLLATYDKKDAST